MDHFRICYPPQSEPIYALYLVTENKILVQVGDLIHRGPKSIEVISLLMVWQKEAIDHNSEVIVLRGNHEQFEIERVHPYSKKSMMNHLNLVRNIPKKYGIK